MITISVTRMTDSAHVRVTNLDYRTHPATSTTLADFRLPVEERETARQVAMRACQTAVNVLADQRPLAG